MSDFIECKNFKDFSYKKEATKRSLIKFKSKVPNFVIVQYIFGKKC